jgi:hypothetical protein
LSFHDRAPFRRLLSAWCLFGLGLMLSACGGGSSRTIPAPPIGSTTGVALSTSTGSAQIQQGANFVITATVTNDANNAGVTWVLTGGGALSNVTTKSVTYTAPTGITGTTTPILTATSIFDTTKLAAATLVVNGLPTIEATTLFPGNVSSPYGAAIVVSGGLTPFTWSLSSGTLPAGITLGTTATTSFVGLSGTPTAAGAYTFQVKVVDKNSNAATVDLTLEIKVAAACLLNGHFALLATGFEGNAPTVGAASVNIGSDGTITGTQDYKSGGATVAESVTGTCSTRSANNGELKLTGTAQSPSYDYATTTSLDSGRIQLENGGDTKSASGLLMQQNMAAFNQVALAGNYAFEALGAATNGSRMAVVGALALDMGGVVTGGRMDANSATALTASPVSGTLAAPDANGRAALQLTAGSTTFKFAAYVIDVNRVLLVSTDDASMPRLAGFMTRQSGSFDNSSLANSAILSLWGASSGIPPSVLEMGRMSNANAVARTVDLVIDRAEHAGGALAQAFNGAAYAVDPDGRFTLSFVVGTSTRHFVGYLDGSANGYLIESGGANGGAGLLEAQVAGPYNGTVPGLFVSGTQFAQDPGPMTLLPAVHLAAGSFSASQANGFYSLDTATGRGIGTLSITGTGSSVFTLYIVGPNKLRALRFGSNSRSATLEWLGS